MQANICLRQVGLLRNKSNRFYHPRDIELSTTCYDMRSWDRNCAGAYISSASIQMILEELDGRQNCKAAVTIHKYFRAWQARKKHRWDVNNGLGKMLLLQEFARFRTS